jgi:hypothetical protein
MKISAAPNQGGQPGQVLGNVEVGRTASPMKLERARQIARGQQPREEVQPQERERPNVRSIRLKTNQTTSSDYQEPQSIIPESVEPAAVEATQPLSPQFAALARQKRALQIERAALEKQKAEMAGSGKISRQEFLAELKAKSLSVMQEAGLSYDELTQAILANPQNEELQALKAKVDSLEKGVDEKFQSREKENEEAALDQMVRDAKVLAKEGDSFALVRETNAFGDVRELIKRVYKESKGQTILDVSEAMGLVEEELILDAEKLAGIDKVRNRIGAPAQVPLQTQPRGMTTLTARDTAQPPMDRKTRAMAAFRGTLKR